MRPMGQPNDLSIPEIRADPFTYFSRLREEDPIHRNDRFGGYVVTRYEDVKLCLVDNQALSVSTQGERLRDSPHDIPETTNMFPKMIIYLDPPEHTVLRKIIGEEFNPQFIKNQRRYVENQVDQLLDNLEQQDPGEINLVEDFTAPLPVKVISRIMGFPAEDVDKISRWSNKIAYTLLHHYDRPDRHEKTEEAMREFSDYLAELVQRRRDTPRNDLITHLIQAEANGRRLDDDEVIATTILLLFAGHETTTKQLANGIYELLRHPSQQELLRGDPSLMRNAPEEILRYHGAVKSITRGVAEDFELSGTTIEEGDRLLLSLAAANRDPQVFDDPDSFDVTRETADKHLTFGHGIHTCIGAPLARLELEVAIPEFMARFPDAEVAIDQDQIEWVSSLIVQGPKELPLNV